MFINKFNVYGGAFIPCPHVRDHGGAFIRGGAIIRDNTVINMERCNRVWFLQLQVSQYVSLTKHPSPDTHQFIKASSAGIIFGREDETFSHCFLEMSHENLINGTICLMEIYRF